MAIDYRKLGQRIREARESKGLSQQELGAQVGLSTTAIALYESGERELKNLELISQLSNVLGVSLKELIENYDTPPVHISFRASKDALDDPKFRKALDEIMKETNDKLSGR